MSDSSAAVTVNGVPAFVDSGNFLASVDLIDGPSALTVEAQDAYGQTVSQSVTVTLITHGPIRGVVTDGPSGQPLEGVVVTVADAQNNTWTVMTDDVGAYTVSGNIQGDFTITFEKEGYFTTTKTDTLVDGEATIINVQMSFPLLLSITSPQDGAKLNATPILVTGTINNQNTTLTVNGVPTEVLITEGASFQVSIDLPEGPNVVTTVAQDDFGQTVSDSIAITIATTGNISGTITNLSTGLTLEDTTVTVTDAKSVFHSVRTGLDGKYTIPSVASGNFSGTISKSGFGDDVFAGTMTPEATITIDRALSPVPPTISNVQVIEINEYSATITWRTDILADSRVDYGETAAYGSSASDSTLVTDHWVALTGLQRGTTYYYMVSSTNSSGITGSSGGNVFSTIRLPEIGNIVVTNITGNSATVTWTTDQPADSLIEYGQTTDYGLTAQDAALTTNHSLALTGLVSGTTYHFQVKSTNNLGLTASSADNIFDTELVMTITLTSPADGAIASKPFVLVQGNIATSGEESKVTVNGVVSLVDGSQFAANHVPLLEGENVITARAEDTGGNIAEASITITYEPQANYVELIPDLEAGLAPLEANFRIEAPFDMSGATAFLNCYGPAPVDSIVFTGDDSFTVQMSAPGLYIIAAEPEFPTYCLQFESIF